MGTSTIASALFGRTRQEVLSLFLVHPAKSFHLRQVIRAVGAGQGAVQRELRRLTDAGILQRQRQGRQVHYRANRSSPVFSELRSLVVKTVGIADVLRRALQPASKAIGIAFVFGSTARTAEGRASDIDLMVIGDIDFGEVVSLLSTTHDRLRREVNAIVYRPSEFTKLVRARHPFVLNVLRQPKIMVLGDTDELEGLVAEPLDRGTPNQRRRDRQAPRGGAKRPQSG